MATLPGKRAIAARPYVDKRQQYVQGYPVGTPNTTGEDPSNPGYSTPPENWAQHRGDDLYRPQGGQLKDADRLREELRAAIEASRGRTAPQAGNVRVGDVAQVRGGPQDQFRAQQMALAQRLQGISSGQMQGAGELATQRQGNRAIAQQQAMARMGRGAGAAGAARNAARNAGRIGLATAGQAQQAALSDQQMAAGQLSQVASQGRGQDLQIDFANMDAKNQQIFQQAGLDQATSIENMKARLAQMGMDDSAQQAYMAQLFGISQVELQGHIEMERIKAGLQGGGTNWGQVAGTVAQVGGAILAAYLSDKTKKKDFRHVSKQIDDMLDKLDPQSCRYKDERHGEGRRVMIMAQDLERSEAGRRIVRETPEGKVIDTGAALSAALASVARLHERLAKVEGKAK